MSESQSELHWISKVLLNGFICVVLFIFITSLFCPIFLPSIKEYLIQKYKDYQYKDNLVKEEYFYYKCIFWIICIVAWGLLFLANKSEIYY
jgi:hypothetical protein